MDGMTGARRELGSGSPNSERASQAKPGRHASPKRFSDKSPVVSCLEVSLGERYHRPCTPGRDHLLRLTSAAFNFEGVVRGNVSRRGETYGEQEGALVVVADAVGTVDSVGGHFGKRLEVY